MSGRGKDWALVSDAAASFLRTALAEADTQGALAVLAEVMPAFDFRPVLAAGTGNVTRRDLAVIRDCQAAREGRSTKARADIDVDSTPEAPESPGLDARDTGADTPAKAPQTAPPRPPKPPAPPVPPPVAPEALANAAQRSAGTPPPMPPQAEAQIAAAVDDAGSAVGKHEQLSNKQMMRMTVEEYHRHFRDTAQSLPPPVHNTVVRWMQKNPDAAGTVTVLDALNGGRA